jgi:hypothetical protein
MALTVVKFNLISVCPEMFRGFLSCLYGSVPSDFCFPFNPFAYTHGRDTYELIRSVVYTHGCETG